MAVKGLRAVLQMRDNEACHLAIVFDQIPFGVAFVWPVKLVEVGHLHYLPIDDQPARGSTGDAWLLRRSRLLGLYFGLALGILRNGG